MHQVGYYQESAPLVSWLVGPSHLSVQRNQTQKLSGPKDRGQPIPPRCRNRHVVLHVVRTQKAIICSTLNVNSKLINISNGHSYTFLKVARWRSYGSVLLLVVRDSDEVHEEGSMK